MSEIEIIMSLTADLVKATTTIKQQTALLNDANATITKLVAFIKGKGIEPPTFAA